MAQSTEEDYKATILTPHSTVLVQDQEIVVRVRTLQGEPAQGVPVRFQLDPQWHGDAKIVPAETKILPHLSQFVETPCFQSTTA